MNKWLGKFWNEQSLKVAVIGDRRSVGGSLLKNILGEDDILTSDGLISGLASHTPTWDTHQPLPLRRYSTTSSNGDDLAWCIQDIGGLALHTPTWDTHQPLPLRRYSTTSRSDDDLAWCIQDIGGLVSYIPIWATHQPLLSRRNSRTPSTGECDLEEALVKTTRVPALSDATGYKDERYFRQDVMEIKSANLVIYCVDMSETRLRGSVLRTLQELKPDWRRTVIVLTFADALPALVRHRDNPAFPRGEYFSAKLAQWSEELKAMLKHIGVEQKVLTKIRFYPVGDEPGDLLPNGEAWLPPLSLALIKVLSHGKKKKKQKAAFVKKHAKLLPILLLQQNSRLHLPLLLLQSSWQQSQLAQQVNFSQVVRAVCRLLLFQLCFWKIKQN